MSKATARIKAVRNRRSMSASQQLAAIDAIVDEEEETEAEEGDDEEEAPPPEDEETEDTAETEEDEADAETEEEDADAEDEEEKPSAKRAAAALKSARRIAASKEAKANPTFALAAIAKGVSFAAFKAMAPAAGKGSNLASRMENEPGSQRLGSDAGGKSANGKVVKLKSAADYYAAAEGKKTG